MQTSDKKTVIAGGGVGLRAMPPIVVPTNPNPTGDPATLATTAKALPESYDEAAYTDTRLRADVNSIKGHCNRQNAVVVAVADGNWSDDATWYNTASSTQLKPVAGDKILVPQGVTVTYDENSSTEYDWLRVDGTFQYDTSADRKIVLDTIFVDHTGEYRIGTDVAPVPAGNTITIEYADNGDLDVTNDPVKMQRGFICFGRSYIYGAPKVAYLRAAGDIAQGATSVTLNGAVTGWRVGDEILITGTRMRGFSDGSVWEPWENETRIITVIDESVPSAPVIHWTSGLTYPHPACWKRASLTGHVANLTRNIRTYTAGNPLNKHRAHQLFKNKDANAVEYMEARTMGRTDMDYKTLGASPESLRTIMDNGGITADGGQIDADTNTVGRYHWHFHRNGPDNPTLNPTVFKGLVGVDSPGWVFVHHDSHGEMHDCIAYDFQAVGFSGEGGGSWGEINNCLASGSRESWKDWTGASPKNGGNGIGDQGHGFWTNSRPLKIKNCIACNVQNGMGWTSRVSFTTKVFPGITAEPKAFYGLPALQVEVPKTFAVIEGFENNESYACRSGGSVAKKQPVQHHSLRSFLNGFKAWEVTLGFHWQYTSGYTMGDFEIIGFNPAYRNGTPNNPSAGLEVFRQTADMVIVNPIIESITNGITFTQSSGENFNTNMQHKVVNPTFVDCGSNYFAGSATGFPAISNLQLPWDALGNGNTDAEEIATGELGPGGIDSIVPGYVEDQSYWVGGVTHFTIAASHTLTDSTGLRERYAGRPTISLGFGDKIDEQTDAPTGGKVSKELGILVLVDHIQMELLIKQEGVYTSAAGDKVLLIPDVAQDRADGTTTYFYTPCALRMPASEFYNLLPNYDAGGAANGDLGPLDDGPGGAWEGFNPSGPAGTPGLK